jgi:hypothetical protein
MGSVVPHPVLGYIWVTLGRVKWGSRGTAKDHKNPKTASKTERYVNRGKSIDPAGTPRDELIT